MSDQLEQALLKMYKQTNSDPMTFVVNGEFIKLATTELANKKMFSRDGLLAMFGKARK